MVLEPTPIPAEVKPAEFDVEKAQEILFQSNEGPQTDFLAASEQEVLYGGAAGGGKSYAMLADPLRDMNNPHFNGLLLRHTTEELRELVSVSQQMYPKAIPGIKWSERKMQWTTPRGGTFWLSYLDKDQDANRYQGQSFTWVGFDELTQWNTPYSWDFLRSRLRTTTASGLTLYQRATTNPGGRGHHWVKKMFIDPEIPGKSFWATNFETGKVFVWPDDEPLAGQPLFKRRFIPASLKDNPYLAKDGRYKANLLSLSEQQRRRLLEGDWDVNEGAAFPEWNRNIHVIEPRKLGRNWTKFRACDYGYGSHSGVLWFTIDPATNQLIIYREMYTQKVTAVDLADMILEAEAGEKMRYGILDSSLWHKRGDPGPSLAEQMIMRGCRWRPSDRSKGSRVSGKNELHRRLQIDPDLGIPRIVFYNTCLETISQIPALPLDKNNPEDVDTNSEDHLYDALRYGIMSRPRQGIFDDGPIAKKTGMHISDRVFGY